MKKRILAGLLSVVMVLTMLPTALAAEGLTLPAGDPSQDETVCICEALCTAETVNAACPVCAGDFTACGYKEQDDTSLNGIEDELDNDSFIPVTDLNPAPQNDNNTYEVGTADALTAALSEITESEAEEVTIVLTADVTATTRKATTEAEKKLVGGSNPENVSIAGVVGKHITFTSKEGNRHTLGLSVKYLVGDVTFDNITWNKNGDIFANGFLLEFTENFEGGCHDYVYGGSDRRAVDSAHLIFNAGSFGNPNSSYFVYGGGYAGGMGTATGPSLGLDGEPGMPGWTPPEFEAGTGDVKGDITIEIGGTANLTALVGGCRNGNVGGDVTITLQADSADARTVSWLTGAGFANQKGYGHVMGDVTINAVSGNVHEIYGTGYGTLPKDCKPGDVNSVAGDVTITVGQESGVPMYLKGTGSNLIGCGFDFAGNNVELGNTVCGDVKITLNKTAKLDDGDSSNIYNQSMYGVYSNSTVRGSVTIINNGAEALFNMYGAYNGAHILGAERDYALKMVMNDGHLRKYGGSYGSMYVATKLYNNEQNVQIDNDVLLEFNGGYTWGIEAERPNYSTLAKINGDVTVTVRGGTIYGSLVGGTQNNALSEGHTATLIFDGYKSGKNTTIPYARNFDEVQVTNESSVIIAAKDGAKQDYAQPFYGDGSVKDLTIDEGATLVLAKNASISGDLTVEGTLALPRATSSTTTLTAGGTATGSGTLKPISSSMLSYGILLWSKPVLNEEYVYAKTDSSDMTLALSQAADNLFVDRKNSGTTGQDVWFINEAQMVKVQYVFESSTDGKELPEDVMELKPEDTTAPVNSSLTLPTLSTEEVTVPGGKWTFDGWDYDETVAIENEDVTITGTWSFDASQYMVSYEFQSASDKALPQAITSMLPTVHTAEYGDEVTPAQPTQTTISADGGVWTFLGWMPEKVESIESNVKFVGKWEWSSTQETDQLWYVAVYYQYYSEDEGELEDENGCHYNWNERYNGQGGTALPSATVTTNHEKWDGEDLGWPDVEGTENEKLGTHYVFDPDYPNTDEHKHRLNALCSEATKDNPLKIYYRAALNDVIYEYSGPVPDGASAVLPETKKAPYGSNVEIADAPTLPGYTFSGWEIKSPTYMEENDLIGDGVFTMPNENVTLVGSWTKNEEPPTITITAMDMGAYTGGESMSGDSFPTPRYIVDAPEGVDLSKITFKYGDESFQVTKENTPVTIGALDEVFIYDEESVKDDAIADASVKSLFALLAGDEAAAENDIEPGEYEITLADADGITVQGNSAKVEFKPGTLTVRYVSAPERIVNKNDNFSTPALTEAPTAQREDGMAIGVLSKETEIKTNGIDSLGVLGVDGEAEIHLMFDGLLPAVEGGDGSVREQMLIDRAKALGYTLTEGQYQYKYLDLINAHDGNAWVTSSQGVDVYWPYPDGTGSSYTFYVLLYDDVNREYGIGTTDKLEDQISNSRITKLDGTPTDAGVKFHLNEGDFGPCALVWTKTEEPAAKYTVTFKPGDHGTLSGAAADGSVQITGIVSGTKLTAGQIPAVNADGKYSFTGWLGSDGKTYSNSDILALAIISNMTFTAQYKKDSSGGGGGGGGGTTYYTLHYESNGGTKYKDERYARNTVVELDKVPTREGYTFTGWYADKELTERITEIKMTSDKTVYAGWEPTGVPDWLNGKDHFAYVVGYTDGTVRPLDNISRAEVATIFFRLLNEDIREENLTASNTFADVNEGMWCNTAISTMAKLGVVKGRSPEHFDPDAPITRAEFAAICARFDTSKRDGDSNFTDIAGHWAEAEIERAATLGWIMGYTDGTFRPENYITRAEAMTMINRVLNRLPESEDDLLDGMNVWPDNQQGAWYYLAVQEATNSHDFNRKGDVHEHWTKLTADPDWTKYQ